MRCEDFRQIADSFLNDELLVETNHEAIRHLETCNDCRKELETLKTFRVKLQNAVINAPDAQIDPAFAARLSSDLRKDFQKENIRSGFRQNIFSLKFLAPTAALLFIALTIGIFTLINFKPKEETTVNINSAQTGELTAMWEKIADQAIGDHKDCGLRRMELWQKSAGQETAMRADFRKNILDKMDVKFPAPVNLLQVHDCYHDGRLFRHAIILVGDKTVSILFTEARLNDKNTDGKPDSKIISKKDSGFQVATFAESDKAVFVISDLPESENLNIARSLSDVVKV